MNNADLPSNIEQGLESWLPPGYSVYVIAVQRCRAFSRLRIAIHEFLGGPMYYTLCDSAEMTDMCFAKLGILVFARTSQVESGVRRTAS